MNISSELLTRLAPTGTLRASINIGNPILARLDDKGLPAGVSIDLAKAFANHVGLPIEFKVFKSAGESFKTVSEGEADFGFFAIEPKRAEHILFTEPYILIEGCYLVRNNSPLYGNDDVDAEGIRVMVGKGSAYDLFLSRTLKNASILRSPTSPTVVHTFLEQGADVAAGVRQQLESEAHKFGDLRLLPGNFMIIRQAMGVGHHYGKEIIQLFQDFIEDAKKADFITASLSRNQIEGAKVAPLGYSREP